MTDRNGNKIIRGSIIDINQTVNGENLFVMINVDELDVRYSYDLMRKYEYNVRDLLDLDLESNPIKIESEIDVVGNIYGIIKDLKK